MRSKQFCFLCIEGTKWAAFQKLSHGADALSFFFRIYFDDFVADIQSNSDLQQRVSTLGRQLLSVGLGHCPNLDSRGVFRILAQIAGIDGRCIGKTESPFFVVMPFAQRDFDRGNDMELVVSDFFEVRNDEVHLSAEQQSWSDHTTQAMRRHLKQSQGWNDILQSPIGSPRTSMEPDTFLDN